MQFYNVKSVEETLNMIRHHVRQIHETIRLPLLEANGHIVAEDIYAPEHVPAFTRSTVDGYAVKAKDTYGSTETSPQFLHVAGEILMGEEASNMLQSGEAIAVPTGGMLPPGSDSVIMIEYCEDMDGLLNTYRQVAPYENVIQAGEDVREGDLLIKKGTKLRAQELGILAAVGMTEVVVTRPLKVGYLSSGDEIVPYTTNKLQIGQVRDMNEVTISTMIKEWGGTPQCGGIVQDNLDEFKQAAHTLYEDVDFLVISGGSSVGTKDYTTDVIQSLGEPGVLVHGVSVKPGKPTIFSMAEEKPILGLPGHPASAIVIFHLFGQAIMQYLRGEEVRGAPHKIKARLTQNLPSSPGRADYIRVRLHKRENEWWAQPILGKSGLLSTLVQSDGLVEIESVKEGIREGEWAPVMLLK